MKSPGWLASLASLGLAVAAATVPLWAAAAEGNPSAVYTFPSYTEPAQVDAACKSLLDDQTQELQRLEQLPDAPGASLLEALDAMQRRYEDTLGPLGLLVAVHPSKPIRDAAEACDLAYQRFNNDMLQNPRLYALLKQVQPADAIDQRFLRDQLDVFEDAGVNLPPEQQARAKDINTELTRLAQDFSRRIREDETFVPFSAAELRGVPGKVWQGAKRDAQGRYLLGLDYPTSGPVIEKATDPAARERMWRATVMLGGEENLATLARLSALRHELAGLFGFDSYDDFVLRRRMAEREADVDRFLTEVQESVGTRELADLAVLRAAKARHLRQRLATTVLYRWDVAFYTERVRQARYAVDQEAFRRYFSPEASLRFVFKLAEQLFGVRFTSAPQTLWHKDAHAFKVTDVASQRVLGSLFVDLYPRADKYNHAAVWGVRNVSTLAGRSPAAVLVVNFNRQGLTLDELETLLHEFGHALHTLLSTTRYASQGGTNVQLDFVEAPSQMLEDWVYDPRVLALFARVCPDCEPVPAELLARADRARRFGKGIYFARQHLYAAYDLAVYGKEAPEPMALWAAMEAQRPLGYEPGTRFPASFEHIATDYAAGYYGYLWSLVLAEDLRTAFTRPDGAPNKLDAAVGSRYRSIVLANGGQVAPAELMRQFLGRPSDSRAFFKSLNR